MVGLLDEIAKRMIRAQAGGALEDRRPKSGEDELQEWLHFILDGLSMFDAQDNSRRFREAFEITIGLFNAPVRCRMDRSSH